MVIRKPIRMLQEPARRTKRGAPGAGEGTANGNVELPSTQHPAPSNTSSGFTLLELLIVMVIIAILAAIAVPSYVRNVQRAKEAVLKEDLRVLRTAIDSYTVDKQQAPQSLQDLVTAGYIREIPNDPITNQNDWRTDNSGMLASIDQTDSGGIDDVHSGAQKNSIDGTSYSSW